MLRRGIVAIPTMAIKMRSLPLHTMGQTVEDSSPWRRWKNILWRMYQGTSDDRLVAVAAGVVFYGLLALFPAITALVSLHG
jgi:uncharacterized BrkB/YihY/UPF0761 family membrane protein